MTTGKGLLVLGGVGVGALVLYELFKPGGAARPSTAPARTPSGANSYGDAARGQAATYAQSTIDANGGNLYYTPINGGGYSAGAAENYGYADTHPGTALPDGVYGPPVPYNAGSGGDDGLMSVGADY